MKKNFLLAGILLAVLVLTGCPSPVDESKKEPLDVSGCVMAEVQNTVLYSWDESERLAIDSGYGVTGNTELLVARMDTVIADGDYALIVFLDSSMMNFAYVKVTRKDGQYTFRDWMLFRA